MRKATIQVDASEFANLGIEKFGRLCGEAGVRGMTQLVCTGSGGIMAIQVKRPVDEEQLSTLDYIQWWERVDQTETGVLYLLQLEIPDLPNTLTPHHELGVSSGELTITDQGIDISLVGNQDSITQVIDEATDAGVPMELRALSDYSGSHDVLDSLTDRQHEIIRTAYERGYYEVPRTVSTAEVAATLDLDPSTVSEHLQRAERNLLSTILGPK